MSDKITIHYEAVDLDTVVGYFVRGYSKAGGEITDHEYFVDTAKGKVIVKLFVRAAAEETPHD